MSFCRPGKAQAISDDTKGNADRAGSRPAKKWRMTLCLIGTGNYPAAFARVLRRNSVPRIINVRRINNHLHEDC
jgi:hypothetical protein